MWQSRRERTRRVASAGGPMRRNSTSSAMPPCCTCLDCDLARGVCRAAASGNVPPLPPFLACCVGEGDSDAPGAPAFPAPTKQELRARLRTPRLTKVVGPTRPPGPCYGIVCVCISAFKSGAAWTRAYGGAGGIENNRSPSKGAYSPAPLPMQLKRLNCLRTCAPTKTLNDLAADR